MDIYGIGYSLIWALVLTFVLVRTNKGLSPGLIASLFMVKLMGTFALQWIFTYHYTDRSTADIYRFFDDGIILSEIGKENPIDFLKILLGVYDTSEGFKELYFDRMNAWLKPYDTGYYNDNQFMIRLNALLAFISGRFYEVHSIVFSWASFQGLIWLSKSIEMKSEERAWALFAATIFPSSLFWLSGGLKESIAMFGIGILVYGVLGSSSRLSRSLFIGLGLILLSMIKLYLLALLIPALGVALASRRFNLPIHTSIACWLGILLLGFGFAQLIGIDLLGAVVQKQNDFLNHIKEIEPGSAFPMAPLANNWLDVLKAIPSGLTNATLRPFPWQINSLPSVLMLIENAVVLPLLIIWLLSTIKKTSSHSSLWPILFAVPVLILAGLTTPVLGAMMRYRAPVLVVLILFCIPHVIQFLKKPSI